MTGILARVGPPHLATAASILRLDTLQAELRFGGPYASDRRDVRGLVPFVW